MTPAVASERSIFSKNHDIYIYIFSYVRQNFDSEIRDIYIYIYFFFIRASKFRFAHAQLYAYC